jgi:ADP-ribosylglycohydrolase
MRSAILGVCYGDQPGKLKDLVRASTRITHMDPKAEYGAMAVALAAYQSSLQSTNDPRRYLETLEEMLGSEAQDMIDLARKAVESVEAGESTDQFARSIGLENGIGGYIYHTVPCVLHAWFRNPQDYRAAILEIIHCGGDTDTTAAILGGIVGSRVGKSGIPADWLKSLWEWPRGVGWMENLGQKLSNAITGISREPQPVFYPGVLLRNVLFIALVLGHGFRRMLPPY